MQVSFAFKGCDISVDIDDETCITISEFSHIERTEFRKVLADGIVKTVNNIIDNPHFKGI